MCFGGVNAPGSGACLPARPIVGGGGAAAASGAVTLRSDPVGIRGAARAAPGCDCSARAIVCIGGSSSAAADEVATAGLRWPRRRDSATDVP
jgi:hypothetical protein